MEVRMSSFVATSMASWPEESEEASHADGGAPGQSASSGTEGAGGRQAANAESDAAGGFCGIAILAAAADCAAAIVNRGRSGPQNAACVASTAAASDCISNRLSADRK
jgi:hypothetical protein